MSPQATNQREFYEDQKVQPSEMNNAFGDLYEAFLNMIAFGKGNGWIWGGNLSSPGIITPPAIGIDNFYGYTKTGSVLQRSAGALSLTLSNSGYCPLGMAGVPDGAAISIADTESAWVLILAHFEADQQDLRQTLPAVYFSKPLSFKIQVIAGTVATGGASPVKPDIPTSGDFLIFGDVLLKNEGSGAVVDYIDYARRSRFSAPEGMRSIFASGYPAYCKRVPMSATPVDIGNDDWTGFFAPNYGDARAWYDTAPSPTAYGGSGFIHDYFGFLHNTWAGALVWDETHNGVGTDSDDGFSAAFFVINKGTSDVVRTVKMRQDDGGAMGCVMITGPFDVADGWAQDATYSTLQTAMDLALTFPPGRSLVRFFWSRRNADKLTAAIINDWMNHADLMHDSDGLRHVWQNGNYELLFSEV